MFTTHLFLFIFEHIDKYNEIRLLIYHANIKIRRSFVIVEFSPKTVTLLLFRTCNGIVDQSPKLSMQTLIKLFISARIRRMGEGNVFTGVCLSTGGGGGVKGYPILPSLPPCLSPQPGQWYPSLSSSPARTGVPLPLLASAPPSLSPSFPLARTGIPLPTLPLPPATNLSAMNCFNDD